MEWYPRYPSLWRAKTRHLDPFQDGCYLRLVDEYMETRQPIPDDDRVLARIIGISLEQWLRDASGIVRAFFRHKDGMLFHDRCDKILMQQDAKSHAQSEKSKKGAQARWNKIKHLDATGIPQAMPNYARGEEKIREIHTVDSKTIDSDHTKKTIAKKIEPPMFQSFWDAFPKQRRGSRERALIAYQKSLTRTTEEKIHEAVIRYAASDAVARGFAKGAAAWLNDDRWADEPCQERQVPNAKPSYADTIQAASRIAEDNLRNRNNLRD